MAGARYDPAMSDVYADIQALSEQLRSHGCLAQAQQLAEAVVAGATGSEILMSARSALAEVLATPADLPGQLRTSARRLHDYIVELLV
jgi:hypothetical protein